jgi:hypothetical protein
MRGVRLEQHHRPRRVKLLSLSVMDGFGRHQSDSRVPMLGVVPARPKGYPVLAEHAGLLDAAETLGKAGAILERLELRFGKRVVVGDVRT